MRLRGSSHEKTSARHSRRHHVRGAGPRGDLPARTYTKAPPYTPPEAVYNWTGFYIGGHIGGAFSGNNGLDSSDGRFLGGLQGGFNYQFAPNWVIGAKPSIAG